MASSSALPPGHQLLRMRKADLNFVAQSHESLVDGVLKIPKEVLKIGGDKLKSVVAQFLGTIPPIHVIQNMLNRLWVFKEVDLVWYGELDLARKMLKTLCNQLGDAYCCC
ncbi:hypothetical protein LINPERPRIM_LOCUS5076 [Linum perenne]